MKIQWVSSTLLLAAVAVSSSVFAAEAVVTWQDPENYTDIKATDSNQQEFQTQLFGVLDEEFTRQAKDLKEGSNLAITVTNFDMAGDVRQVQGGDIMRVVIGNYYPQMTLNYTLTDASGAVLSQQQDVNYKDQGFYSGSASLRASQSSNDFYYETTMIRSWFAELKRELKK